MPVMLRPLASFALLLMTACTGDSGQHAVKNDGNGVHEHAGREGVSANPNDYQVGPEGREDGASQRRVEKDVKGRADRNGRANSWRGDDAAGSDQALPDGKTEEQRGAVDVERIGVGEGKVRIGAVEVDVLGKARDSCAEGGCKQVCPTKGACKFTCSGGNCAQQCGKGSDCKFTCSGGTCTQACPVGSNCELTCSGGGCKRTCDEANCAKSCSGEECSG
jgi:hypothetical protein